MLIRNCSLLLTYTIIFDNYIYVKNELMGDTPMVGALVAIAVANEEAMK